MYGVVSSDHSRARKSSPAQRTQSHSDDRRRSSARVHNNNNSNKSMYGRFVSFVKQAWTGVKFALGKSTV